MINPLCFSKEKAFYREDVLSRRCSIKKMPYQEDALSRRCSIKKMQGEPRSILHRIPTDKFSKVFLSLVDYTKRRSQA
jgi:hypothetical protein